MQFGAQLVNYFCEERCDRLEEALEVIKLLFTEGSGFADYDGCYYPARPLPPVAVLLPEAAPADIRRRQRRETHAGLGVAVGPLG